MTVFNKSIGVTKQSADVSGTCWIDLCPEIDDGMSIRISCYDFENFLLIIN